MSQRLRVFLFLVFMVGAASLAASAAQPPEYDRQANFTDHSENYPDEPHSGNDLDNEFNAVKTTIDAVLTNMALIQRDDGDLANGSVGADQLTPDLLALLGQAEIWETATDYEIGDIVYIDNGIYEAATAHTSGTFAADLADGDWDIVLDYGASVLTATSASSVAIGTGTKSFQIASGKYFAAGQFVMVTRTSDPSTSWMFGQVTSYSGSTLTISVAITGGSGTFSDWTISISGARGATGADGTINIPSQTAYSSPDAQDDALLIYSSANSANRKITPENLMKIVTDLTQDTNPSGTDDFLMTYDASASGPKKIVVNEIFETINSLTTESSIDAANDYVAFYEAGSGQGRKVAIGTLVGNTPFIVGVSYEWNGPFAPSGTVFEYGQAISRTTYADLMDAITAEVTGDTTNGNNTITNVSVDLTGLGLEGAAIEGTGIPSGRTITSVTTTTIVMSGTASATGSTVAMRIFPHGNGNGSTTFNVPDSRGRAVVGRDNMGASSADRLTGITNSVNGDVLGASGGIESQTLVEGQLPSHAHAAGSLAASTGGAHTHGIGSTGSGSSGKPSLSGDAASSSGYTTTSSGDHTHTISGTSGTAGSGQGHNNVPPSVVKNRVIGTGV